MIERIEVITERNGQLVFNLCASEASDDPIRAARLRVKAEAGDEKAKKKLAKIDKTPMYRIK